MLKKALTLLLFISSFSALAQKQSALPYTQRGMFYFYWGWNWSSYTKSDIHFTGNDHDFTLFDVVGTDRPSRFTFDNYFSPFGMTTPQFNARFAYFFKYNWELSFGTDHMKYVAKKLQTVKITGEFEKNGSMESYTNEDIRLTYDFLQYEHTDGLNYVNFGLRRVFNLIDGKSIDLNIIPGFEAALILPRSDVTLLGKERSDRYHLSGYGMNLTGALNITFFDKYFIQSELKGGYVNLPKVLTSFEGDTASQDFFFSQINIVLGAYFHMFRRNRNKKPTSN